MSSFTKADAQWLAKQYGWQQVQDNGNIRVIGFCRGGERINVYYTTGTVGTCTDHPLDKGKRSSFDVTYPTTNWRCSSKTFAHTLEKDTIVVSQMLLPNQRVWPFAIGAEAIGSSTI